MSLRARIAAVLAFGALFGPSTGCRPAPTGTTKTNEGTTNERTKENERNKGREAVTKDDSFRLGDIERVELKQGGTKVFEVSIHRGAAFRSEVKFSLQSAVPHGVKGITFTPADWQLNSNESSMTVTARAAPDAAVGTFTWNLIVRPRVGQVETRTLTVVVSPRG